MYRDNQDGYVGLVSDACFADFGHYTTSIEDGCDQDCGLYETGFNQLGANNATAGRLDFSLDLRWRRRTGKFLRARDHDAENS